MKNLIAELREMGGRLRPEAADALEQQAAVIEQLRSAFRSVIYDEGYGPIAEKMKIAEEALALKPCPEVLNKVKADAVARFAKYADDYEVDKLSAVYIQRLLKGEV